jgi:type II secretory pathway component PulF
MMIVMLALVVGAIVFALFLPLIKMISEMSDQ